MKVLAENMSSGKNIRRFVKKRDLIGTWEQIRRELRKFLDPEAIFIMQGTFNGTLLRFLASKEYTPYIFTKQNKEKLLLRKHTSAFYIPGDNGQIEINKNAIFKVEEIADTMFLQVKEVKKVYNVKLAPENPYY